MKKPSRYEELGLRNILRPIMHKIQSGSFEIGADHKIRLHDAIMAERPWLNTMISDNRECGKWMDIYFKYYFFIPIGCRNCWKVCFKPKTLKETFRIWELQKEMNLSSKVGVETRGFTGNKGGYAAFWYAPLDGGLKQAKSLYNIVDAKIQALFGREEKEKLSSKEDALKWKITQPGPLMLDQINGMI